MDERGTEEKVLIVKSVFSFWTPLESLNVETKPCEKFSGVIPLQLNSQQWHLKCDEVTAAMWWLLCSFRSLGGSSHSRSTSRLCQRMLAEGLAERGRLRGCDGREITATFTFDLLTIPKRNALSSGDPYSCKPRKSEKSSHSRPCRC